MYSDSQPGLIVSPIATAAVLGGVALTATTDLGGYAPGYYPVIVRAVSCIVTTTATVTAPVLDFYNRPTAGSDTSRVLIKRLNPVLASWAAGKVIYGHGLNSKILPGGDVIAELSTAATAGNGHVFIYLEPSPDVPGNNTNMILV